MAELKRLEGCKGCCWRDLASLNSFISDIVSRRGCFGVGVAGGDGNWAGEGFLTVDKLEVVEIEIEDNV